MNIVDFSEGILGLDRPLADGRQSRDVVARCLQQFALIEEENRDFKMSSTMSKLARELEAGNRVSMEMIRELGEKRIREVKELFLRDEKETGT